ncbi:MarR family winged helix-turn-helix transcriptional regulator [Cellulomonas sp. P24]|uniref:MarR family winged helix-turn-helix transcriptional regulator n=1 Tax=Cellulomonas sp. P24 TaxID=2885206 RepID=UPI00216ADFB6|nr:MarR family winged helix-turn-helix transcriptional regulator [Cellulomonas sp. P24]MCR6493630.1 MarR family winged helix-turn-helix transcriptional regulator [Cellulomonas sp. P24]
MPDELPARLRGLPTWMVSQAAVRSHRLVVHALSGSDARGHHYRLLVALHEQGSADQSQLGRRTALDRSDVAVAVDELERRGLVRRRRDPDDGRRKRVEITDAGISFLTELDTAISSAQDELLRPLPADQRQVFLELLGRLQPDPGGTGD